ncbi:MAG: hypothetical protein ACI9VR_002467 [Cognaticolwellia sp.]|jgi:hypothetical protein
MTKICNTSEDGSQAVIFARYHRQNATPLTPNTQVYARWIRTAGAVRELFIGQGATSAINHGETRELDSSDALICSRLPGNWMSATSIGFGLGRELSLGDNRTRFGLAYPANRHFVGTLQFRRRSRFDDRSRRAPLVLWEGLMLPFLTLGCAQGGYWYSRTEGVDLPVRVEGNVESGVFLLMLNGTLAQ